MLGGERPTHLLQIEFVSSVRGSPHLFFDRRRRAQRFTSPLTAPDADPPLFLVKLSRRSLFWCLPPRHRRD